MRSSRATSGPFLSACIRSVLAALLLLLAGGCASLQENSGAEVWRWERADPAAGGLFVPAAAETETIEPTVIKPTVVADRDYRDPLLKINRAVFAFNDVTYRYALIPLSKRYLQAVPASVRQSIGNFFVNLKTPIYLVNYMLQLQAKPMLRSLQRFGINTTIGLLGLFDPASNRYGIEKAETDFEDSLMLYGAGYGVYLVLPIFGPADIRSTTSLVVDYFLNPIPYLVDSPGSVVVQGVDHFQEFAPEAEQYEVITRESKDPYIFLRNLYLQGIQRDAEQMSRSPLGVNGYHGEN